MILWLMLVLAAGTYHALPTNVQITPDTPLDSLTLDELDQLLSEKLVALQVDILKTYEEQLREHEETLHHLHRHRRDVNLPQQPTFDQENWHSYVYDTRPSREIALVTDLVTSVFQNVLTVMNVFPVALDDIHAIYKMDSGHGYILKDDQMHLLMVRNQWTNSPIGCSCPGQPTDMSCACCAPGGVLCQVSASGVSNTCVEDSALGAQMCVAQSSRPLELDYAIAFEYHTFSEGVQQIVVIAKGESVNFYKLDQWGLQDFHSLKGHNTITLDSDVTHLGYGEVFVEQFGTVARKRYLFTFGLGSSSKRYYEVLINPEDLSIETGFSMMWDTTGTSMKVWQNGGRVVIGVQDGTNLNIHELTSDRWGRQQISLQQVLSLPAMVTSWRSYATGFENFIVATTPTFARVYMESRGEYQILQNLLPTGSLPSFIEMVPVNLPSCKDEVILMTGLGSLVQIFVWDGTKGLYTLGNETSLPFDITGWDKGFGDVRSISTTVPKLILKSTQGVVGIDIVAELLNLEDPVWDESLALKNRKQYLENEYTRQIEVMGNIEDRLSYSVDTATASVDITGDVTILNGVIMEKTLTVTDLTANNLVFPNTDLSGISYTGYKDHLAQLANSSTWLQIQDDTLTSIEIELEDAVSVTTSKKINGRKVIVDGLTVQELNVDSADFQKVLDNGDQTFPITSTLEGLVKFADPRKIMGKKTFATRLDVTNLETGSLDDIPVSDVATTTGSYAVTGSVNFVNTIQAKNIALPSGGTVGGIDLTNAVTLNGPAKLGYTIFNKNLTVAGNLQVDSTDVDGVIIEQLYRNALTKAGGRLKGSLEFINDVTAKSLSASLLSGVSSPIFLSTTVFKDESSHLTGKIRVPTLTAKSLQVGDMVNGKDFPSDFPLKTDATLTLGTKAFNDLTFGNLIVGNGASVDGILFENLVTLHRAQTMTGSKTVTEGVDILGSLQVPSSLVAGVNFDELHANLTAVLDPTGEGFDVYFKNHVKLPTVAYGGLMNMLNIVDLSQDIIYSTDSAAAISGTKEFTLPLSVSHATFENTFNGVSFEELVHSSSNTPIAGVKTFKKPVTFSGLDVTGLVDGVDLKQLFDSALYLDKAGQVVTGRKTFTGPVSAGELNVQGRVSGVDFNKVLANNGDQTFTVPQKFAAASFGALDTNQIDLSDGFTINDYDISVLDGVRMSRKNPTPHDGVITVNGMVSVLGSLNAVNINGHNVAQLKNNIVTDDADSTISSDLSFGILTVKGSVSTANKAGANGRNISRIHENAVLLGGNNAMTGSVTWGDLDLQGDVAVGGLVNGKDLQMVHNDAVYKDASSVQITGEKVFNNGLSVNGDIVTETTNGIDLSTRLFTLHTDQDITAAFTFDSVTAEKNLTLDGTFDGVDLERLDSQALKQSLGNIGNIVFNGEVTVGDFKVAGSLENIDVNLRLQDAVRLTDQDVIISGKKSFVSDVTFKNIFTTNLNNIAFNDYLSHAVRKNVPITLARPLKVNGLVSAPSVTANSLSIQGSVDGIDYKDLMTKSVLLDGTQSSTSNLQFANDVSVKGNLVITRLNDLEVDTHYLTTNTPQTFITNVEVNDIHASTNVAVLGKVNSVNLPAESLNTLKISGGQTVTGLKSIQGLTIVSNNVEVTSKTGDDALVDFSTEVVYLTEAPTISVRLNFSSGLTVSSLTSTSGEIGDIDLVDLANQAWYYNEPALVTASLEFALPVVMKETLLTSHPVDGMLVSAVYGEAKSALETYSTYNEGIKSLYINKCPLIEEAYEDTQRALFDADYFDLVQELQFSGKRKSSGSVRMGNYSYVPMSWDQTCDVTMHKYGTNFVHTTVQYSNVGSGKDWIDFEHNGNIFFLMAASAADNSCSRTNSVAFKLENGGLTVHQELVAGEKVEKAFVEETGTTGISITMGSTRHVYSFSSSNDIFEFVKTSPALDAMATMTDGGDAIVVTGETGKMKMAVNGLILHELEVLKVDDATMVKQYGKVFLMCSVTRQLVSGVVHNLELYLVDTATGLSWLDSKPLNEPAKLTRFFTGNAATGTTLVVALQKNWYPIAYTIHGMKYKLFVELNAPLTWWAEYFSVPDATFPELSKHALLIGQASAVKLLELKMNGLTHEAGHVQCNPGAFKYPELMPIVPV
ncbi:uncharacterized protein LOC125044411 [Penaeus chinensis]|uniref:uncharacterized protein LOC125044411 n=1 Tax=Penaeus chinensis TaxID=139456 RepID=UPI001FB6C9AA|nr:uncharacterized protein LOC125044411 [Penaeus chinensis]